MEACDFSDLCSELAGAEDTEFNRTYEGVPSTRILLSVGDLRVMADLSPLMEGHLLIVPVRHYLNFAEVSAAQPDDLGFLLTEFLPRYRGKYGIAALLEHGSSTDMRASACINHAHLHLVPLAPEAVKERMRQDGLAEETLGRLLDLASRANDDIPYFLCSDGETASLYGVGQRMEKQYLRSVVARVTGLEDGTWDWASYIRRDVCRSTISSIQLLLGQTDSEASSSR